MRRDRFLDLAPLAYGDDRPSRRDEARALLDAHPVLAEDLAVACVLGHTDTVRAALAADPEAASRPTGPRDWPPLLYLTYGRVFAPRAGESGVATASLLLDAGADPDSHFWWGSQYRFTAITGALGEGEGGPRRQPAHPEHAELLQLLLTAGARADDGQGLYNRLFSGRHDHLPPLLAHGLRADHPANWRVCADGPMSTFSILSMVLTWDADHGNPERVRLVLDAGVDPRVSHDGGLSPWRRALRGGHPEVMALLEEAGAEPEPVDDTERLLGAIRAGDRDTAMALRGELADLQSTTDDLLGSMVARTAALRLALELGVSPTERDNNGATALHQAAWSGRLEAIRVLLAAGADPDAVDGRFNATPLGWATHAGQTEAAELLAAD
ncbi:MAG: hypothetical protein ACI8PZ_002681 [Myxococcota bacterium]|jgi:hypothetical protein